MLAGQLPELVRREGTPWEVPSPPEAEDERLLAGAMGPSSKRFRATTGLPGHDATSTGGMFCERTPGHPGIRVVASGGGGGAGKAVGGRPPLASGGDGGAGMTAGGCPSPAPGRGNSSSEVETRAGAVVGAVGVGEARTTGGAASTGATSTPATPASSFHWDSDSHRPGSWTSPIFKKTTKQLNAHMGHQAPARLSLSCVYSTASDGF